MVDALLKEDNDIKLENINLAIEREQIFSRMQLLHQEKEKFKKLHTELMIEFEIQKKELFQTRAHALNDGNTF